MNRMYESVNALKSAEDEMLNVYFLKPVDKKVSLAPKKASELTPHRCSSTTTRSSSVP